MTAPTPYEKHHVEVQYTSGVWTDITADVDTVTEPIQATTGSTAETTGDPASLTLVLHNPGFKYTPGNSLSAYALTSGMRIRMYDLFGEQRIYTFTGFIEFPEIESVNMSMTQDQTLRVSAVDQISRWERSSTFISTLSEYIRYTGGTALKCWWPLNDDLGSALSGTYGASQISGVGPLVQVTSYNDIPVSSQLEWAERVGPPGDDSSYVQFDPSAQTIALTYAGAPRLARRDFNVPLTAGEVFAIMAWAYVPTDPARPAGPGQILVSHANAFADPTIQMTCQVGVGWGVSITTNAGTAPLLCPVVKLDAWSFVAVLIDATSGAVTLCVDRQVATGSLGGASTGSLQEIALNGDVAGGFSWGQVQILSGPNITSTTALAQFLAGFSGLERQTTGDRIKTLARYAGKTDADLTLVDTGGSIMQVAQLAGKTVAQAMYEARDTEQGDLFIDGSGLLNFDDRRTLLNI